MEDPHLIKDRLIRDRYLLVKGRAGLGNRIVALLTAILYARLTRRKLLVDWTDDAYSDDQTNAIHQCFTSDLFGPGDPMPSSELAVTESVSPPIWSGRLNDTVRTVVREIFPDDVGHPRANRNTSVNLARIDHPEQALIMWSFYEQIDDLRRHFTGEFASLRGQTTETILSQLMRDHLHLHPSIQERVDAIRAAWAPGPRLGVHIRYSDKKTNLDKILNRVDHVRAQQPGIPIFLATDSAKIQDLFLNRYQDVATSDKWFSKSGQPLHRSPERGDRIRNAQEALIDCYLLASCNPLVLDLRSALAQVATIASNAHEVHDVRPVAFLPNRFRRQLWVAYASVRWRFSPLRKQALQGDFSGIE